MLAKEIFNETIKFHKEKWLGQFRNHGYKIDRIITVDEPENGEIFILFDDLKEAYNVNFNPSNLYFLIPKIVPAEIKRLDEGKIKLFIKEGTYINSTKPNEIRKLIQNIFDEDDRNDGKELYLKWFADQDFTNFGFFEVKKFREF